MILVSIIVPVYNVKLHIANCIESLLSQIHQELDILLIDDGSQDGSGAICDEYGKRDNRIRVFHQANAGVSVARNVGIGAARGEYIIFLDGDDRAHETMVKTFLSAPLDFDIAVSDYYTLRGEHAQPDFFFHHEQGIFTEAERIVLIKNCLSVTGFGNQQASTNVGVPWAKMYRTQFIRENALLFVPGLKRMQDTVFNLYAFKKAATIRYITEKTLYYVIWGDSAVRHYNPDFLETSKAILNEIDRFAQHEQLESELDQSIRVKSFRLFMEYISISVAPRENCDGFLTKIRTIRRNSALFIPQSRAVPLHSLPKKCRLLYLLMKCHLMPVVLGVFMIKKAFKEVSS
jgi:glycosyltransferase involved in cell wall biosynthesis